ncbi:DUF2894 domain-containing protein [Paraburkholderia tagetis]|uniref:DUF2894 domain-containing protein n=1 Tax=Paraburkholderia tagetis TaxID=2913261 RepID=A0A9X1UDB7_9BURK|nr:DUF2894 domain-containing protein [Paraburkholderia tagetis]MCG5071860.1 DUF2894 domain-containing protein [Paraburkholderia tagetis]
MSDGARIRESEDGSENAPEATRARATLDAWRAQGADRLDPVRYALIDALDRRAGPHAGAARRVLDARIDALLAAYAAEVERATSDAISNTQTPTQDTSQQSASQQSASQQNATAHANLAAQIGNADHLARSGPPAELLDYFREVWSKLSADQQVQQSLDQVPKNAGPLNSSSLVHRALLLMRELSPGYLRQFLAYADALSWLEDLSIATAPAPKETPRASAAKEGAKKGTRKRAR